MKPVIVEVDAVPLSQSKAPFNHFPAMPRDGLGPKQDQRFGPIAGKDGHGLPQCIGQGMDAVEQDIAGRLVTR